MNTKYISSRSVNISVFSLVLGTCEKYWFFHRTRWNIFGIHPKIVIILYIFPAAALSSCSPLLFLFSAAALSSCSPLPFISSAAALSSCSPLLFLFSAAALSSCSPLPFIFSAAALSSYSPLLFIFPAAAMFSCSPLLFLFSAAALSSCSPLSLIFSAAALSSCSPLLFLFSAAALSSCSPLPFIFYAAAALSSCSPLLFIFPAAAISSCSPILIIFPAAAISSCSPILIISPAADLSSRLTLLFVILAAMSFCSPLPLVIPAATLSSCSLLFVLPFATHCPLIVYSAVLFSCSPQVFVFPAAALFCFLFSLLSLCYVLFPSSLFSASCYLFQVVRTNNLRGSAVVQCQSAWLETTGPLVWASPASLLCGPWARHIYPSSVLVKPRKSCFCLTERLLMGCKESNQTKQNLLLPCPLYFLFFVFPTTALYCYSFLFYSCSVNLCSSLLFTFPAATLSSCSSHLCIPYHCSVLILISHSLLQLFHCVPHSLYFMELLHCVCLYYF